MNLQLLT